MPFTISHAAAAIPFRRTKLVLSALVIGCMAPDFEYFLHAGMYGRESHNLRGALEFALPATLILLTVFHVLLKRPIVALLPRAVQERVVLTEFRFWPSSRLVLIVASALVGIATHRLWDSFTQPDGWAVKHIVWFREQAVVVFHNPWPNYKLAQHGSTVLGLVLLAGWFLHWYRTAPRHATPVFSLRPSAKFTSVCAMLAIATLIGYVRACTLAGPPGLYGSFVANAIVAFVSAATLELLLFSIALRIRMQPSGSNS
jgi:hypothetical protein